MCVQTWILRLIPGVQNPWDLVDTVDLSMCLCYGGASDVTGFFFFCLPQTLLLLGGVALSCLALDLLFLLFYSFWLCCRHRKSEEHLNADCCCTAWCVIIATLVCRWVYICLQGKLMLPILSLPLPPLHPSHTIHMLSISYWHSDSVYWIQGIVGNSLLSCSVPLTLNIQHRVYWLLLPTLLYSGLSHIMRAVKLPCFCYGICHSLAVKQGPCPEEMIT